MGWLVGLTLGLRQGEALGLCWRDIDLDTGTITVRRALQRATAEHGRPSHTPTRSAASPQFRGMKSEPPLDGSLDLVTVLSHEV